MSKKRTAVIAAAAAFAASPQGQKLLAQAKEYATRPENQRRAQELVAKARTKLSRASTEKSPARPDYPVETAYPAEPTYPQSSSS
jgi:hypothetical protein